MRKFLSVLLAMAMVLSLTVTSFAADTAADAKAEMAGKTVILHTNDVHGAVEGYAYIAQLKADYEAKGAEVILVDAGDFSQGTTYVSSTKGADAVTMMNAAGYDVARRERAHRVVFVHELLAVLQPQDAAETAHRLADQE